MYYRAAKDLHVQLPPESLSISLNLLLNVPSNTKRGQYFVDVERKVITGYPEGNIPSRRVGLLNFAKHFHDGNTLDIMAHLADKASCRRSKLAAVDALAFATGESETVFKKYLSSNDEYVRKYSEMQLVSLEAR
jgi:hypothetical protein